VYFSVFDSAQVSFVTDLGFSGKVGFSVKNMVFNSVHFSVFDSA